MEPINNPDPSNTSQEYWEAVLCSHGLSMRKGSQPRKFSGTERLTQVLFVGGLNDLVGVEEEQIRADSGQVTPKGKGPDQY